MLFFKLFTLFADEFMGITLTNIELTSLFDNLELNERQRRIFYGSVALYQGRNGVSKVAELFDVNPKTVRAGIKDITGRPAPKKGKVRRQGGGRKKDIEKHPEWRDVFDRIVEKHKAGLPQNEDVFWINLSYSEVAELMQKDGCMVSTYHVKQLAKEAGLKKRSFVKDITMGEAEFRNEQFEQIYQSIESCKELGIPIFSIDTKKKELIGNFKRNGKSLSNGRPRAYDHDYEGFADAKIVPHGVYDIVRKEGFITIGLSHDTSQFVCENIERIWLNHLSKFYPGARTIVILCDGGGSNVSSHHIVKQDLMDLADRLGINIWMIHYPPYCSKYNPIEHGLFAAITKSWSGTLLNSVEKAAKLAAQTKNSKGLKVHADIIEKEYDIKRKLRDDYEYRLRHQIVFHEKLPKWNYLVKPMPI